MVPNTNSALFLLFMVNAVFCRPHANSIYKLTYEPTYNKVYDEEYVERYNYKYPHRDLTASRVRLEAHNIAHYVANEAAQKAVREAYQQRQYEINNPTTTIPFCDLNKTDKCFFQFFEDTITQSTTTTQELPTTTTTQELPTTTTTQELPTTTTTQEPPTTTKIPLSIRKTEVAYLLDYKWAKYRQKRKYHPRKDYLRKNLYNNPNMPKQDYIDLPHKPSCHFYLDNQNTHELLCVECSWPSKCTGKDGSRVVYPDKHRGRWTKKAEVDNCKCNKLLIDTTNYIFI
jgi:hypothetical protein